MIQGSGHPDQRKYRAERQVRTRAFNCPQQSLLVATVGDANPVERELRYFECDNDKMQEAKKPGDATTQYQ
jgi:hypothetical protein